jgi:Glutathione S-transferase, N-terminal domain
MTATDYKVTIYTYYGCPYAHRVHIALNELGVKYDEVHIDLDKPREPWYLEINPVSLSLAARHLVNQCQTERLGSCAQDLFSRPWW